jgi:ubiquinone/menaquinone biosynthesis C-methylase UbiE
MDFRKIWEEKHKKYANQDWIDRPNIFAQFAISYFPKEGKLLDLGAGQGQDSRYFSKKGYYVIGTDFSETAIKLAREKTKKESLKINFLISDLSKKFPFTQNEFDIVYSHLALQYFSNVVTKQLFEEIFRVTKTEGIFATLLNTMEDPEVKESKRIEKGLYMTPSEIIKRFYDLKYLKEKISGKFEPLVIDTKGETYKDEIKTLVRFIGRKI